MINFAKQLFAGEEGATMVEYALMVALIAAVCITAVTTLGTTLSAKFGAISTSVGTGS